MMEYGTGGWLARTGTGEPAPWDRHRFRFNLPRGGDSEAGSTGSAGGSGAGGTGNSEENRTGGNFPPFSRAGGGFDMSTLESLAQNRQLNFRSGRQPFQNFDLGGGQGTTTDFSRLLPGFAGGSSGDNRDNFQRSFFGGKEDFSNNQNNRPFGQRDPVNFDRDPTAAAMIRFSQNFDLNNRSDRQQDGASGSAADRAAPFGRRGIPNSPRLPPPNQFDRGQGGPLADTFNFSGLPVDPWLPSGTTATAPHNWPRGPGGNQDFQPPAAGAQMFSASMALQRMSSQQNRKRPWQQLLSVVGRRSSTDLPIDPDISSPNDPPAGGSGGGPEAVVGGSVFTTKARQGRKQSKPLKHEGSDQHVADEDDVFSAATTQNNHHDPMSTSAPVPNNNNNNTSISSNSTTAPLNPSADDDKPADVTDKDMASAEHQSENNSDVFSVKSPVDVDKDADLEEVTPVETFGDYSENPLRFDELRTLFPLTLMYGEPTSKDESKKWPQSSVVLSTVEVQQKNKPKVRYCFSARSEDCADHPEVVTINKLRAINVDLDMTLKVTLVMNYTPCFFCACCILSYFFDIKARQINIAMELKFSNLYRVHMYPCDAPSDLQTEIDRNIDGLQTLHMNGVGLQTFSGIESWYENLLNTDFLHAECKEKLQEIVEIVESEERKEREERDEEDLCNILGL